jgi:hypothetical protein
MKELKNSLFVSCIILTDFVLRMNN